MSAKQKLIFTHPLNRTVKNVLNSHHIHVQRRVEELETVYWSFRLNSCHVWISLYWLDSELCLAANVDLDIYPHSLDRTDVTARSFNFAALQCSVAKCGAITIGFEMPASQLCDAYARTLLIELIAVPFVFGSGTSFNPTAREKWQ